MKILLATILFFFIQLSLFAQEVRINPGYDQNLADSLRSEINQADTDTTKAYNMISLSWAIEGVRPDSALIIANQAYELLKSRNSVYGQVNALRAIAYNQMNLGDYAESLKSLLLALELLGYPSDANINRILNADVSSLDRRNIFNYAEVERFIGHLYGSMGNWTEQMSKFTKALKLHEMLQSEYQIANTTFNIANVYLNTNQPDSAITLAERSLVYFEKEDIPFYVKTYLGYIYNIIGNAYLIKKNFQSAEEVFLKSEKTNIQHKNLRHLAFTRLKLSNLYNEKREYEKSLEYAQKAKITALETGLKNVIAESYSALATSYQNLNMADSGYYYLKLATPLIDSLNTVEKNNLVRYQNILFAENQNLQKIEQEKTASQNRIRVILLLVTLGFILLITLLLYRNNRQKQTANNVLESTLTNLKSTQAQLIQSEKMASLGELTAGIAHEIQNPLNFVNNFSEVSIELIEEVMEEVKAQGLAPQQTITEILSDIQTNLTKITHHGKRADAIVKGMLEHSRTSSGEKTPTDINALADEYLRLSYHGLRAKDKSFNAEFKTNFDPNLPKVNVVPQDIGRVLLNLINNAFQAINNDELRMMNDEFKPLVTVATKNLGDKIEISVSDNGPGIPDSIKDKIFQPFFTTKPTGQGTGLGLSLSYDIIKAHGGELKVETKIGEGTTFIIELEKKA
jgi:two-component system, NtrC family, sensor kinase